MRFGVQITALKCSDVFRRSIQMFAFMCSSSSEICNRNYRKVRNADDSYTYIITVDGEDVEVSAEIYKYYAASDRQMEYMEYDLKRDRVQKDAKGKTVFDEKGLPVILPEREVSLDKLIDEDWDYPSSELSPEDAVIGQFEIKALYESLDLLDDDERELIDALFFNEMTIREYAGLTGKSKSSVDRQKTKILGKLKIFLTN